MKANAQIFQSLIAYRKEAQFNVSGTASARSCSMRWMTHCLRSSDKKVDLSGKSTMRKAAQMARKTVSSPLTRKTVLSEYVETKQEGHEEEVE